MTLKDRMKAAWQAMRGKSPVDEPAMTVRSRTISSNSPEGRALIAALRSQDTAGIASVLGSVMGGGEGDPKRAEAIEALGGDAPGNSISWERWTAERKQMEAMAPGWTGCRFFNRVSFVEARGVFGVVRGHWGIYCQPFDICHGEEDTEVLPVLSHLHSGLAIGCFDTIEIAVEAATILDALDWASMPEADEKEENANVWRERLLLVRKTLGFHGIAADERHAHDPGDPLMTTIPVLAKSEEALIAGKPRKKELS